MKKFTFIFVGLLLLLGGASIQAGTVNLPIKGGKDWSAWSEGYEKGTGWSSGSPAATDQFSGTVKITNGNPKFARLGGKGWSSSYDGQTQTFTMVLNNSIKNQWNQGVNAYTNFVLVAIKGGTYKSSGDTNDLDDSNNNWDGNNQFKDGNGSNETKIVANSGVLTPTFVNNEATIQLEVNEDYDAVYFYTPDGDGGSKAINIVSFTLTIGGGGTTVATPTISPASSTYDGDLTVTITKGDGNDRVVYSVSGATTGNAKDAEFTENSKTLNLTGTGTITVTATGYKGEDASSEVTNTYSIPSGQSSTTSGLPHTFNSWNDGNSITFNNSFFSNIETGDYVVFDVANVEKDGTVLGFRDGYNESPYVNCTTTSGGNGAKGTLNKGDTQWWMKVNSDVVSALKNHEVRMQGGMIPKETAGTESDVTSSVTLNSLNVYKCEALNESSDNLISSKINHVVVELTRSFKKDTWNTVCLPFSLTPAQATQLFGSGYQLAEFTDVSGTTMKFTTAASFEAGVPYLVKPTIDVSNASPVVLVDVNITAKTPQTVPHGGYSFVGNFTQKTFSGGECNTSRFVATGNELMTPENGTTLKSLRCYFTVPATPTSLVSVWLSLRRDCIS